MSIKDIADQFETIANGRVRLNKVTMSYLDGGARELVTFTIGNRNIEIERDGGSDYSAAIQAAVDRALA